MSKPDLSVAECEGKKIKIKKRGMGILPHIFILYMFGPQGFNTVKYKKFFINSEDYFSF